MTTQGDSTESAARVPAEAFFLPAPDSADGTPSGYRFCQYHAPQPASPLRGALVYLHPFGDEMNRARRMVALQARRLSDAGYGVLLIDLFGCGDSSGASGEASWARWKADAILAVAWLKQRLPVAIGLWGLRLGALLALDVANDLPTAPSTLVLWHPVLNGKTFMTQFLRLRLGSDLLTERGASGGTQALRAALHAGETLEIAGYHLAPALVGAIDALDAKDLLSNAPGRGAMPIYWFDIERMAQDTKAEASPLPDWRRSHPNLHSYKVKGLPFWATPELATCPALLEQTVAALNTSNGAASCA